MRWPRILRPTRLWTLTRRRRRARMFALLLPLLAAFALLAPVYIVYKPPNLLIRYLQHRYPDVLWQVDTQTKVIALTIDDAPSAHTRDILRVLGANNASATFFVIGSQVAGPEQRATLREIVRSGNELGNHAMHDEPAASLSDTVLASQIKDVDRLITDAYGATDVPRPQQRFFRPGSGFFNARMRANVASLGYKMALGGIYPHDPFVKYWWINARHVLSLARPGAVVICHDRRSWTVPMLEYVLPKLTKKGFRVVSLRGLMEEVGGDGKED